MNLKDIEHRLKLLVKLCHETEPTLNDLKQMRENPETLTGEIDELFTEISNHFDEFKVNHEVFTEKGNKAAGTRARKAIGEIKKLVTEYRKESVASTK